MGRSGWIGVGWPKEVGGRALPLSQQMIFHEEYARAGGPGRGRPHWRGLARADGDPFRERGPEGTLPAEDPVGGRGLVSGLLEPGAGSDLANVQTRAELQGDEWIVNGQKVWTSGAEWSDWCFVVCRNGSPGPAQASWHLVSARPDGPARRRGAPDRADDRGLGVQRGLLQQREGREGRHRREGEWRLGGRDGNARVRARSLDARPADAVPERARSDHRDREAERHRQRPADPPAHRPRLDGAPDPALPRAADPVGRRRRARSSRRPRRSRRSSGRTGTGISASSRWT